MAFLNAYRGHICLVLLSVLLPLAWAAFFSTMAACGTSSKRGLR